MALFRYCIPMDTPRPSLDLKHFNVVCHDKNVPVIAVFTKYDDFKRKVNLKHGGNLSKENVDIEATRKFESEYLSKLEGPPKFVQLEKMHKRGERCDSLIAETSNALDRGVVALMLLAVQRGNLEMSVRVAVTRTRHHLSEKNEARMKVMQKCLECFPYLWLKDLFDLDEDFFKVKFDLDFDVLKKKDLDKTTNCCCWKNCWKPLTKSFALSTHLSARRLYPSRTPTHIIL